MAYKGASLEKRQNWERARAIAQELGVDARGVGQAIGKCRAPSLSANCFLLWRLSREFLRREENRRRQSRYYHSGRGKTVLEAWRASEHGSRRVKLHQDKRRPKLRAWKCSEAGRAANEAYHYKRRILMFAKQQRTRAKNCLSGRRVHIFSDPVIRVRFRRRFSVQHAIAYRLRSRIGCSLRNLRASKSNRSIKLLGCTVPELKTHLESLFLPGMSWGNRDQWHIDHVRPLASWDLTSADAQKEAFHWSNLQPLWALDNLRKGKKILQPNSSRCSCPEALEFLGD